MKTALAMICYVLSFIAMFIVIVFCTLAIIIWFFLYMSGAFAGDVTDTLMKKMEGKKK